MFLGQVYYQVKNWYYKFIRTELYLKYEILNRIKKEQVKCVKLSDLGEVKHSEDFNDFIIKRNVYKKEYK